RTILQIIPTLDAGGAERTTLDIAEGLTRIGARALVASEGGRLVGELQAKGGIWLPFPAADKKPWSMAMNIRRLSKLCAQEKVDLVHARSRAPAWVALASSRGMKLPFVTTYHGSYNTRSAVKTLYNSVMARGDVVIANSYFTADLVAKHHPFARPRLRVIHRGTNLEAYAPAMVAPERVQKLRAEWGVESHQRLVLLPGRLTSWKGQTVLIEAAKQLVDGGLTDTVFILAGDHQGRDDFVKKLDTMIVQNALEAVVKRVGHCTDMPAAYLAASVVTVPSTDPEAFGRVAVESQAMGTPVVVSDHGAVPETVLAPPQVMAHLRTGWRVKPGDAGELAAGIAEALALRPSQRDALAIRARSHVEQHFSLDHMVAETLDVYTALLGG
ncbi:MAG: glycosyltransferase family 4 protein, partial [Bosea sp. (in: a-proteobacteria)]